MPGRAERPDSGLAPGPTVGICRALDGFRFLEGWRSFLAGLGCEVLVSGPTNRQVVDSGVRLAPAELCLPVKAYVGHALALRSRVEFLLVPRVVCRVADGRRLFGCPKAIALPDMLRALVPDLPPVVELRVDERERSEHQAFRELAAALGFGRGRAQQALRSAEPFLRAGPCLAGSGFPAPEDVGRPVVAVVGHDYLVEDEELSLGLLRRLAAAGAAVLRPEGASGDGPGVPGFKGASGRPGLSSHRPPESQPPLTPGFEPDWWFERELIGQAMRWAARPEVAGLLLASSFACGTSAVTNEIIRRAVRRQRPGLAVIELLFDEQTGPAGLTTRLESFVELLRMRR